MHYYQFNIGDYVSSTQHLDENEDLAYRRMLDIYYSKECALPEDQNQIARLIRMRTHSESIAVVLREFFKLRKDGYHCDRADKEISAFQSKSDKARKSAQARWNKNKDLEENSGDAKAMRTHSEGNAKHKTLNTNHKTIKDKAKAKRFVPVYSDWNNWDWPTQPDEDVFDSWLAARKKIKGGISELSFKRLGKEFCKATNLNDCLAEMELRGWKGFKSDWMQNNSGASNGQHQQHSRSMSAVDKVREATEQWAKDRSAGSEAGCSDDSVVATYDRNIRS